MRKVSIFKEIDRLKHWKPEIVFQLNLKDQKITYLREPEDLIAYMVQKKFTWFSIPAWRFSVDEQGGRRYYYVIEARRTIADKQEVLITGDATDYSGHGSYDKQLIEAFITEALGLPIEDRPLSYLFGKLVYYLSKVSKNAKEN